MLIIIIMPLMRSATCRLIRFRAMPPASVQRAYALPAPAAPMMITAQRAAMTRVRQLAAFAPARVRREDMRKERASAVLDDIDNIDAFRAMRAAITVRRAALMRSLAARCVLRKITMSPW